MEPGADPRGRADRQRQDHRRELPRRGDRGRQGHPPFDNPLKSDAGFLVLRGNLFDSAIMKTSVISTEFRERYLSNPDDPEAFEGRGGRVRRAGGLPRPDRRSVARRSTSTRCCSCAAPARSAIRARRRSSTCAPPDYLIKQGITRAAVHRRRPPVGHLGLALDPQRLARGGGRRRPRDAADRRPGADRPQQGHGRHPDRRRGTGSARGPSSRLAAAIAYPEAQTPWQEIQRASSASSETGAMLEGGEEIPAHRPDQGHPARQPLRRCGGGLTHASARLWRCAAMASAAVAGWMIEGRGVPRSGGAAMIVGSRGKRSLRVGSAAELAEAASGRSFRPSRRQLLAPVDHQDPAHSW